jgi:hypothetical protein
MYDTEQNRGFIEAVPIIHFCSQTQAHHSNALYDASWQRARGKNVSYNNRISNAKIKSFSGTHALRNKISIY